ncbi:Membrane protease YdiL, CAAX protease family [Oscillospiraceae bacterium]|nr:Membrane protease YdiL, CAAX protease family [Oscillospiraceae bacterium]
MERLTNQERLKPWMGVVFFAVLMGLFVTVCAWMQGTWGVPGLIATELLFAGMSVLLCVIRKVRISEVFPIKKITLRDFFGCVVLLIGTYMLSIASIMLMQYLVPSSMAEAEGISGMLYGPEANFFYILFAVGILPAICEEMAHRGAIFSSFRGVKHEWIPIVVVGLFFSINHLSVLRGPFTFILGAVFAYVMVKRNNILLTMMMHCMLNSFSVCLSFITGLANSETTGEVAAAGGSLSSLGLGLILGCAGPVLLVTGMMIINPKEHKAKRYIWAGITGAVMLFTGIALFGTSMAENKILSSTISYEITEAGESELVDFTVEEEGTYVVQVMLTGAEGDYHVTVADTEGNVACQGDISDGMFRIYQENISPEPDDYVITIDSGDNAVGEHPSFTVTVQKA